MCTSCSVEKCYFNRKGDFSKAGWRCGCISSTDHEGRQFWVVAAERQDAGCFIVHADEKLTVFLELEYAIRKNSIDTVCPGQAKLHPR
jgi:hypothetical protein